MIKFKVFVLFLFLILCCGCQIDYSLTIDERGLLSEKIRLISDNEEESQRLLEDTFPYPVFYDAAFSGDIPEKIDGVTYYATEILKNGRYYEKLFQHQFVSYEFSKATSLHTCYENVRVYENAEEKTTTLSTSSEFLCMASYSNLNQTTVRIESHLPVVVSNADKIEGNMYTWFINRSNYQNKKISITYQFQSSHSLEEVEESENSSISVGIVFSILGFFLIFIVGVFVYNYKQRNHS